MKIDYTQHDELDEPIKIRWSGYTRARISEYNASFERVRSDRFLDAMHRQKTNVVIKTVQEAQAVYHELENYHPAQRIWLTASMYRSIERVRNEIKTQLEAQGHEL